jgi:hypothetical protein
MTPMAMWITRKDEIYVVGTAPALWSETPTARSNWSPSKPQILVRFDTDGRVHQLWTFARTPAGQEVKPGDVNTVHSIAVGAGGELYLADIAGKGIQKFAFLESESVLRPKSASR